MLLEFFAALASGFAVFGVLLLLDRLSGRRLARWLFPAGAGLGMIAYTVWSEYSWADRVILPDSGYVEASRNQDRSWFRPWTYVFPQTNRIIAVDHRLTRTHQNQPDLVLTRVALLARWMPEYGYLVVFDCAAGARADLFEGVELREDGTLDGADWLPLEDDDPVMRTACQAREGNLVQR